jgi:hypothetical protein
MMDRGFGYAQNAYQKENFIGGLNKTAILYALKPMNSKRYYGMETLLWPHFRETGEKLSDK